MKSPAAFPSDKPTLVGHAQGGALFLRAVRCSRCGTVAFPPQHHGCERCGAVDLVDITLAPRGRVVASCTVHVHAQPTPATPFTMAEVRLEDGPTVRARLSHFAGDPWGRPVQGVLRETEAGSGVLEFRFEVAAP
jgi:uncharacterized OB-fold protein